MTQMVINNLFSSGFARRTPFFAFPPGFVCLTCFLLSACDTGDGSSPSVHGTLPQIWSAQTGGCNPDGEPTWEDPVNGVMQNRCVRCHQFCGSYTGIQPYIDNGKLESYAERDHYISGTEKADVLRWLEIGAPESDCDVPGEACGNSNCAGDETCASCPVDCGVCCGNGECDSQEGEDCGTCVEDCAPPTDSVCCANQIVRGNCCLDDDCSAGESCTSNSCQPLGDSSAPGGSEPPDSTGDSGDNADPTCEAGESCDDRPLVGYGCSALPNLTGWAIALFASLTTIRRRRSTLGPRVQ